MSQGGNTFGSDPSSFPEGGPPKRGMSTGVKVLLILGGVFGVLALACCGFGIWIYNKMVITDPQKVVAIEQEIVSIQVPDRLKPVFGMDISFGPMPIKMAVRVGSETEVLTLMGMAGEAANPVTQQQMQAEMKKQGKQPGLRIDSNETRNVTIGGEEVAFVFSKGVHEGSGKPMRQVRGVFEGRDGTVMLQYMALEEEWDDAEVMTMLRSISK